MGFDLNDVLNTTPEKWAGAQEQENVSTIETKPASPHVFELDDWSIREGSSFYHQRVAKTELERLDNAREAATDFLSAAFEPDHRFANCDDERRVHFMKTLFETPEFKALHADTANDLISSQLAAMAFMNQYQTFVNAVSEDEFKDMDDLDRDAETMSKAADGCKDAREDVESVKNMARGVGGCDDKSEMDPTTMALMFERVQHNSQLRGIIENAGRFMRLAASIQRGKKTHGQDEVVGITVGDELNRLMGSEMVRMCDDSLELDFLRRFAERSLNVREMGVEKEETCGPIVFVIDESGSMGGGTVETAKAMALAMLWIAQHQKRWACLVGYSGDSSNVGYNINPFVVDPNKPRDVDALTRWLGHFYSGGSDLDLPIGKLPEVWDSFGCPKGKTDVIQITDARISVKAHADKIKRWNAWRERENVRVNTIVLNNANAAESMKDLSDKVYTLDRSTLSVDDDAVVELFEI